MHFKTSDYPLGIYIYIYNPMFQRFDVFVYQRSAYFGSEYIYLLLKLLFGWLHVQPSKTYSRGCITIWWMCMGLCEGEGACFKVTQSRFRVMYTLKVSKGKFWSVQIKTTIILHTFQWFWKVSCGIGKSPFWLTTTIKQNLKSNDNKLKK